MKKVTALLLALAMVVALTACGNTAASDNSVNTPAQVQSDTATQAPQEASTSDAWNFKIGIMAHSVTYGEENYRTSTGMVEQYGSDKVIVDTYPDVAEQEIVISKVLAMAADPEVKVIIFNIADAGTIAAITALKEVRDDIITICGNPVEDVEQIASVADLILMKDHTNLAKNMVAAAADAGAKTFVHYSFPRHMSSQVVAQRAEVFKAECDARGITYVEATTPDPNGDSGVAGTQQFILEDIPLKVAEYGKDTCFFGTQSAMFEPIIKAVCEEGALYFGQSDPSCIDHFPGALGIQVPEDKIGNLDYMHEQIAIKVKELGMEGRIGTWKQSVISMVINCAFDIGRAYASGDITVPNDFEFVSNLFAEFGGEGTTTNIYTNTSGAEISNVILYCGGTIIY